MSLAGQKVICCMASIPARVANLERIVPAILPQVDELRIFLNGHRDVPKILRGPKFVVARSDDYGDIGDTGKFHWCGRVKGFYLTLDDDVLPQPGYVDQMLARVEEFGRAAVVGNHGSVFKAAPIRSYLRDREIVHFTARDRWVHGLGTGAIAFHSDAIQFGPDDCPVPNMTDVWFAVAAKKQGVPLLVARGRKSRMDNLPSHGGGLYERFRGRDQRQTKIINDAGPWPKPLEADRRLSSAKRAWIGMGGEPIYASLASFPARAHLVGKAVKALLPQVDRVFVCLNEYKEKPKGLDDPRVTCFFPEKDLGAAGKFFAVRENPGFHIVTDDDLTLPPDYADKMIASVERYRRQAIVGVHGYRIPAMFKHYRDIPKEYHFHAALGDDRPVDILGTGHVVFHSSVLKQDIFELVRGRPRIDPIFALLMRQSNIPLICVARQKKWVRQTEKAPGLYEALAAGDEPETETCRRLVAVRPLTLVVPTYNRPGLCLSLLKQVESCRGGLGLRLVIIDDASTEDYAPARKWIDGRPWAFYRRNKENRNRKRFWQTINEALDDFRMSRSEFLFVVQDDTKLKQDFFNKALALWDLIEDEHKGAMNIMLDGLPRSRTGLWGSGRPALVRYGGHRFDRCGWVDGFWMTTREAAGALGFALNEIPASRFINSRISAGDGEQITQRLREAGFTVYRPKDKLLETGFAPSVMHPDRRIIGRASNG